jgi:hypothetical protein
VNRSDTVFAPNSWLAKEVPEVLLPGSNGIILLARSHFQEETEQSMNALWQRFAAVLTRGMESTGSPIPIAKTHCLLERRPGCDDLVRWSQEAVYEVPDWTAAFEQLLRRKDATLLDLARTVGSGPLLGAMKLSALLVLQSAIAGQFTLMDQAAELLQRFSAKAQPLTSDTRNTGKLRRMLAKVAAENLQTRRARSEGGKLRKAQLTAQKQEKHDKLTQEYRRLIGNGTSARSIASILARKFGLSDRHVRRLIAPYKKRKADIS